MSTGIRIVLAGIGGYGIHYVHALLNREKRGDPIGLVALADPAASRSPVYGLVKDRPCFADLAACLAAYPADLVIIASPIQFHAEQIKVALAHGAHVLCEKPLCATLHEALQLLDRQRQSGRQVGIGYQWSFSPAIRQAKADVLAGRYGAPQVLRTRVYWPRGQAYYARNSWAGRLYSADGRPVFDSVLNNATAHYLHNMLFFLGQTPHEAAVPERIESRLLRANDIETFDTALLRMEKTGPAGPVVLALAVSHCPEYTLEPHLDYQFARGRLVVENGVLRGFVSQTVNPDAAGAENLEVVEYGQINEPDPVAGKIDALLAAVKNGARPACDLLTASAHAAVVATVHQQSEPQVLRAPEYREVRRDGDTWRIVPGLTGVMDRFVASCTLPEWVDRKLSGGRQVWYNVS